jgi:hypothetical protein
VSAKTDSVYNFFNLIPPTPFSSLEKGEKTILGVGLSPLARLERGFRGEVIFRIKKLTCIIAPVGGMK